MEGHLPQLVSHVRFGMMFYEVHLASHVLRKTQETNSSLPCLCVSPEATVSAEWGSFPALGSSHPDTAWCSLHLACLKGDVHVIRVVLRWLSQSSKWFYMLISEAEKFCAELNKVSLNQCKDEQGNLHSYLNMKLGRLIFLLQLRKE